MSDALLDRVCAVITAVLGVEPGIVTATTQADDLEEWDSLNLINLMMAFEAEFGITLEVDDAAELTSVEVVLQKLRDNGAA